MQTVNIDRIYHIYSKCSYIYIYIYTYLGLAPFTVSPPGILNSFEIAKKTFICNYYWEGGQPTVYQLYRFISFIGSVHLHHQNVINVLTKEKHSTESSFKKQWFHTIYTYIIYIYICIKYIIKEIIINTHIYIHIWYSCHINCAKNKTRTHKKKLQDHFLEHLYHPPPPKKTIGKPKGQSQTACLCSMCWWCPFHLEIPTRFSPVKRPKQQEATSQNLHLPWWFLIIRDQTSSPFSLGWSRVGPPFLWRVIFNHHKFQPSQKCHEERRIARCFFFNLTMWVWNARKYLWFGGFNQPLLDKDMIVQHGFFIFPKVWGEHKTWFETTT